jgi:hypothetical protein
VYQGVLSRQARSLNCWMAPRPPGPPKIPSGHGDLGRHKTWRIARTVYQGFRRADGGDGHLICIADEMLECWRRICAHTASEQRGPVRKSGGTSSRGPGEHENRRWEHGMRLSR